MKIGCIRVERNYKWFFYLPLSESLKRDSLDSSGDFPQRSLHVEERRLVICVSGLGNPGAGWYTIPGRSQQGTASSNHAWPHPAAAASCGRWTLPAYAAVLAGWPGRETHFCWNRWISPMPCWKSNGMLKINALSCEFCLINLCFVFVAAPCQFFSEGWIQLRAVFAWHRSLEMTEGSWSN